MSQSIFTAKPLADGQLPTSKGTLYTVPASTSSYVKNIHLFNTSSTEQTILLYLNVSGTSRLFRRIVLAENESSDVLDSEAFLLEPEDLIEALTTTVSVVDYVIMGVEES